MLLLRLLKESFNLAFSSLINNKLRTFLSLLGITIGIFAIISVFTVLDSLERSIRDNIGKLGDNVIYVQKWPWVMGPGGFPWWKYVNRPVPSLKEYEYIKKHSKNAQAVVFQAGSRATIKYKGNSTENTSLIFASKDYDKVRSFELEKGRYFTPFEFSTGKNKAIIGSGLVDELFDGENPINKSIKIRGYKLLVIGVFKKEGSDMFGNSSDYNVLIPINYVRSIFDIKKESLSPQIIVKAKPNISLDHLNNELIGLMRKVRHLKPKMEDNFALNQTSMITQGFDKIFIMIDLIGLIIGGFSILVGGFGIANIMFVSVKERTKIIGIQKSLGAKNYFILFQFLSESVVLSLVGGILGLIFIWIGTIIASKIDIGMTFEMSLSNILSGILISIIIGVIAGFAPARSASKLNPVDAINSNF